MGDFFATTKQFTAEYAEYAEKLRMPCVPCDLQ